MKFKKYLINEIVSSERIAKWSKKFKSLEYWDSKNTNVNVNCDSLKKAKVIIKNSKIEQKLKIIKE